MAEFENPGFDPDWTIGDSSTADNTGEDIEMFLPDASMDPPIGVQQGIHAAGNIPRMRGELQQTALDDQKKGVVMVFYDEVLRYYFLPQEGSIDYIQFRLGEDNKTLFWVPEGYWTPDGKQVIIRISVIKGELRFLAVYTGLRIRVGWHGCNSEITGAHWL